jgi:hypothetical protein
MSVIKILTEGFLSLINLVILLFFFSTCVIAGGGPAPHLMGDGNLNDCGPNDHYDSGDAGGNYLNSENYTETYCSNVAGDCIEFNFMSFDTESCCDDLTIHDGPNVGSPVIGTYQGTALPNGGLITSSSGCLTFVWSSDGSVTRTGWQARYSCIPCPAPSCSDGILNQGETGIDCGGPCPPCGLNHNIGTGNFTTCVGNLFDSGGSGGNYSNSENFTETYCSDSPGDCINLNFSSFSTESCCDHLNIYDGPNTASALIGTFNGTNSPGLISSTGTCLTFQWTSDGSVVNPGWAASISCGSCATCTDGILNGLEVGIDCGGPTCPPCPCSSLPVTNDEACCALSVTVNPDQLCGSVTPGTVASATPSFNANTCFGTDDDDVWFSFVATNTTHYIDLINVAGSTTDLYHAVYGGTCSATGASLICNDLNSTVLGGLTIGNTYFIRVYTYTSTSGQNTTFDVCVGSPPPPPTNDGPCSSIPAAVNPDVTCTLLTAGYCVGATQTMAGCVGTADDDVWFRFTALSTQQDVSIMNASGTTDLVHEVFSGTCGSLTSIGCSDPNTSSYSGLTVGDVYFVRVYTYSATGNNTSFDLCINSPCGLINSPPDCGLNYTHSTRSYNPRNYNSGTVITFSDDRYADAFTTIGFDFCFDGVTYQDVMVSSNGYLIFPGCYSTHNGNEVTPGGYSSYSINAAAPNSTNAPQNAIMGPWQDIDPSIAGSTIRTRTHGTAPNRIFIAKFSTIGMFSCTTMDFTGQIMLFETSNNIEVHLGEKTTCTTFNSGAAIMGLNNFDGTTAVIPAGYNYPTQWSVPTNAPEGHRFTCNCDPAICLTLLPMDIVNFEGKIQKDGNLLNWVTATEENSDYFVIEKSTNAVSFFELGRINAAGTSTTEQSYEFMDPSTGSGLIYYRLRMVDTDGHIGYSKIIALNRKSTESVINLYPNPVIGSKVTLKTEEKVKTVYFSNYLGQKFKVFAEQSGSSKYEIDVSELTAGSYIVEIEFKSGQVKYKKVVLR